MMSQAYPNNLSYSTIAHAYWLSNRLPRNVMTETEGGNIIGWREGLISLALLSNLKNAEGFVEKYTYCLIDKCNKCSASGAWRLAPQVDI